MQEIFLGGGSQASSSPSGSDVEIDIQTGKEADNDCWLADQRCMTCSMLQHADTLTKTTSAENEKDDPVQFTGSAAEQKVLS